MKRLLTILFLLIAGFVSAQEIPPAGLKAVNSQFYIHLPDSTLWQNKGTPYGWHRVAKYKELTAGLLTKADITYVDSLLALKLDASEKGATNGVASLVSGKVPLSQMNDALIGSVNYKGTYSVATNTPALPTAVTENKGWYYLVSDATAVYAGDSVYAGDWIISNGSAWATVRNNRPEVDPTVSAIVKAITSTNISNWNISYTDRLKWDGGAASLDAATGRASLGLGSGVTYNASAISTPSTLALRDGAGNGTFRAIVLDTDGGLAISSTNQTNGQVLAAFSNTGGSLKWGIENSVGSNYLTGSAAYSSFFGTTNNTPLHFGTNGVVRQTISGTGATTFSGSVTAPTFIGALTGNASTVTGGVYTSGNQTIADLKTFSSTVGITGGSALQIESATTGFSIFLQATAGATSSNTISLPNATGTVALTNSIQSFTSGGTGTFGTLNSATIPIISYANTSQIGLKVIGTSSGGSGGTYYYANDGTTVKAYTGIAGTSMGIMSYENGPLYMGTNSSEYARIAANGDFSIGTSSGGYKLNVAGTGNFSGALYGGSSGTISGAIKGGSFNTVSTSSSIPFTTWTTFYTIPSGAGIYLVTIGLDNSGLTDWVANAVVYSSGSDAAFFNQHNASLVQIRLSGMDLQVFQNGGSPSSTLTYRILKMQ